jgi:hypothetical protein
MSPATETMVGEVLEPVFRLLPPETVRRIVELEAGETQQRRVEQLAARASEGLLSPDEQREYANLVAAGDILATLQALARRSLQPVAGSERGMTR